MKFHMMLTLAAMVFAANCFSKEGVVEENGANLPENPAKPAPGIETGTWWSVEDWANKGKIARVKTKDRKVLRLNFEGGKNEKTVFKYLPGISVPPDQQLRLHVYSDEENPPKIALVVSTTLKFVWHESQPIELKRGWNEIAYPLNEKKWKTQAKGWQFNTAVDELDDNRCVCLLVLNGDKSGSLLVEGFAPKFVSTKAEDKALDSEVAYADDWKRISRLGRGFVAWESKRGGDNWRIWIRNLDGSGMKQLSPDDPGRDHFCAHISPDGKHIAYLAYPENTTSYEGLKPWHSVPLHLIHPDGSGDRVLASHAEGYWGDRAVVWVNSEELIYIAKDRMTRQININTKADKGLTSDADPNHLWLINATKTYASTGKPPRFSPYDAAAKVITKRDDYEGCQSYFSHDGSWGFWMNGSGGPVSKINLITGETGDIVKRRQKGLPPDRGYIYMPMLSRDSSLFVFAASRDEHSYYRADYDLFVCELNPRTLEVRGRPVRYTFEKTPDAYPDVFVEAPELGRHYGKAPHTVTLAPKDDVQGWTYNFGDGTAESNSPQHTFEKSGQFFVEARKAGKTARAIVEIDAPSAPHLVSTQISGEKQITIAFSEPIDIRDIECTIASGISIKAKEVRQQQNLVLTLSKRIDKPEMLLLSGVSDQAQQRSKISPQEIRLGPPAWPTNPEGVVFKWQTYKTTNDNEQLDAAVNAKKKVNVAPHERAYFDRNFGMKFGGGSYTLEGPATFLPAVKKTNLLTIEATITPAKSAKTFSRILSCSSGQDARNFTLAQDGDKLMLRIRTTTTGENGDPTVKLCSLAIGEPNHVVVCFGGGDLQCYLNGRYEQPSTNITGELSNWTDQPLIFGDEIGGGRSWYGTLEGVAIYNRTLSIDEAKANFISYSAIRAARPAVTPLEVDARVSAMAKFPKYVQGEYGRKLVVHEYAVERVIKGECKMPTIRVCHWAYIDRKNQPIESLQLGSVVRLKLEPEQSQPQLSHDNKQTEGLPDNNDIDVPLFYDLEY